MPLLTGRDARVVAEIEAEAIGGHQAAGLLDVQAERFAKRRVEQVGRGVVAHRSVPAIDVDLRAHQHSGFEAAVSDPHVVDVQSGQRAGGVGDRRGGAVGGDHAVIGDLASGARVERRAVEDDQPLLASVEPPRQGAFAEHGQHAGILDGEGLVAEERGAAALFEEARVDGVALDRSELARLAGPLLLRGELLVEAGAVDPQAPVPRRALR